MLASACSSSGPCTPWTLARTSASRFGTKMGAESPPPLVCPTRSETSARSCSKLAIWPSRASMRARRCSIESGSALAGVSGMVTTAPPTLDPTARNAGQSSIRLSGHRWYHDAGQFGIASGDGFHRLGALLQPRHDFFGTCRRQAKDAATHAQCGPLVDGARVGPDAEDRDRNWTATRRSGQLRELGDAFSDGCIAAAGDRHPLVAVLEDATERMRALAADDDRRGRRPAAGLP